MTPRRLVVALAVASCAAWCFGAPCAAQPAEPDAAEAHYARGIEARQARRDAEAVEAFRAAWEIAHEPRALAQLALAEQAVGRWVDAFTHLRAALAEDDEWIESHREVLERARTAVATHVGQIEVDGNVEGADVVMDGVVVGQLPLDEPIPAPLGAVVVEARAPGYVPVQRRASVDAGRLTRVSLRLVPELTHTERTRTEPAAAAEPALRSGPPPAVATPESSASPLPWLAVATGAVAVLLTAAAITAGVVREQNVQMYNDDAQCDPFPDGRRISCPEIYATWRTAEDWAIGLGIGAGVAALGALTLLVVTLTDDPGGPRVAVRGNGVALHVPLR